MKEGTKKHTQQEGSVSTSIIRSYAGGVSAEEWLVSLMVAHLQAE